MVFENRKVKLKSGRNQTSLRVLFVFNELNNRKFRTNERKRVNFEMIVAHIVWMNNNIVSKKEENYHLYDCL